MHRVLVIDPDLASLNAVESALTQLEWQVVRASCGPDAWRVLDSFEPEVAFVDSLTLGHQVILGLRAHSPWCACVVMSEFPSFESIVRALQLGVCDWIQKPVCEEEVRQSAKRALIARISPQLSAVGPVANEQHAVARIVGLAVLLMRSGEDWPTLRHFARAAGVSEGGIRNWCRTAGLAPKNFLQFSRALRAVALLERDRSLKPENLLAIVDKRTMTRFLDLSGGTESDLPDHIDLFLDRQRFIKDPLVAATVRRRLTLKRTI